MEIRLPLLWIGVLAGQIRGSLAATSGVETFEQVIKYLLVGADAVMTTSALLRHGVGDVKMLVDGATQWLDAREVSIGVPPCKTLNSRTVEGALHNRCELRNPNNRSRIAAAAARNAGRIPDRDAPSPGRSITVLTL
jgi:hypothetical protein